jgi:putative hydrolase
MPQSLRGTAGKEQAKVRDWNRWIAARLRDASSLLEQQGANPFRVNAYARAAETLEGLDADIAEVHSRGGLDGLVALPNIGRSIATAIVEMLRSGRWLQLERLRGSLDPVKLYQTIPGIGPKLAEDICSHLHTDTLEALETAAYDGRLGQVPGVGERRATAIRQALASMLQRRRGGRRQKNAAVPPAGLILDVDREYRAKAEAGKLALIQPRRFASDEGASLPIFHAQRDHWHFTVLYSNTPRAHELGRTRDWVVIYFHADNEPEQQCTVVTEHFGPLRGLRVIRGREVESGDYHAHAPGNSGHTPNG